MWGRVRLRMMLVLSLFLVKNARGGTPTGTTVVALGVWYPTIHGGVGALYPTICGGAGQGMPCPYGTGFVMVCVPVYLPGV